MFLTTCLLYVYSLLIYKWKIKYHHLSKPELCYYKTWGLLSVWLLFFGAFLLSCLYITLLTRNQLKDQLLLTLKESNASAIPLLEIIVLLIDLKLPWSCVIVGYFSQNNGFALLRQIILTGKVTKYFVSVFYF